MPNPLRSLINVFSRRPEPISDELPTVSVAPEASGIVESTVSAAGMFEVDGLIDDGPLDHLRGAKPPRRRAELTSVADPRDPSVVYQKVAARPVKLNHGSVVEGSTDFGGIQPNYVIDLFHPRLQKLLGAARKMRTDKSMSFPDKLNEVTRLVQKELLDGAYDAPAYLALLEKNRNQRTNVTLGDYLVQHAGVCRENALLTHLALTEAGIESTYVYGTVKQGTTVEDHAVALAVDDEGTNWIVDSYNSNFNGRRFDDVARPGGPSSNDPRLDLQHSSPYSDIEFMVTDYPDFWVPQRALAAPNPPAASELAVLRDYRIVRPGPRTGQNVGE